MIQSNENYVPENIETYWQSIWQKDKLYKTRSLKDKDNKFYALSMFPYPSGDLHMGHVRNYVITDVIARYKTMSGASVLHPMGWDAFGLPAENAAIDRGINPEEWTKKNIEQMKLQLQRLGLSIDWSREFATCDSSYYKWTQYIFLELYKSGLVYRQSAKVNWDPVDKTVLANEQVDSNGNSWRSGAKVIQKELNQWFLRITNFSENLLSDLEFLDHWPEKVKTMQENWINKSEGAYISFQIKNKSNKIKVFTTRPDTLSGVTYLALSIESPLIKEILDAEKSLLYNNLKQKLETLSKTRDINQTKHGFFTGSYALNPLNNEEIPIWIATYVISEYGTGSVMGVPAHDQRDYDFAFQNNLPIKQVITNKESDITKKAYEGEGRLINSLNYNDLDNISAKSRIIQDGIQNNWAESKIQYRLRDWLISRQRYWGCPIPIIHCSKCGIVPEKIENLPIKLPKVENTDDLNLSNLKSNWINTTCPECSRKAKRETDTMDTFMCSSWYFLRFADPLNNNKPFDKDLINQWLPVDQYVGGIEHAILHLLYARFLTKALHSRNLIEIKEPFKRLLTQGMVLGTTYKNPKTEKYIPNHEIKDSKNPTDPSDGSKLKVLFEKMSKSKYNGIDPSLVIDKYGADTARMFILFKAPPEKDLEWDDSDLEGQFRFLSKIWKLSKKLNISNGSIYLINNFIYRDLNKNENQLRTIIHKTINNISEDFANGYQFNTAISELMKLSNFIIEIKDKCSTEIINHAFINLTIMLSPFAPHIAEEIWKSTGASTSVHLQEWPTHNEKYLVSDQFVLVIQINGKVRDNIKFENNIEEDRLKEIALKSNKIKKWLENKEIKRIIYVKNKLLNIVI